MSTRQARQMRKRVKNKKGPEFEEEKLVVSLIKHIPSLSFQGSLGIHFLDHSLVLWQG